MAVRPAALGLGRGTPGGLPLPIAWMNFNSLWLDSSDDPREALPPGEGEKAVLAEYLPHAVRRCLSDSRGDRSPVASTLAYAHAGPLAQLLGGIQQLVGVVRMVADAVAA